MKNKLEAKKRMMFIQKEDYNYLTYSLILILSVLDCNIESKRFRDFRKIAYLVDFISSSQKIADFSQDELVSIYSKAQLKKKLLSHLLVVLKNKKYLEISLNNTHKSFDIWLIKENIPIEFFNLEIFKNELVNINLLKKDIKGLKITPISKMVNTLFTSKKIMTWEI